MVLSNLYTLIMTRIFSLLISVLLLNLLVSCSGFNKNKAVSISENITVFPDYTDIVVPPNIAPLNFSILNEGTRFIVDIIGENGYKISIRTKQDVRIPIKKWRRLLSENSGKSYKIQIFRKFNGVWESFPEITNHISTDFIDSWITYRLVHAMYDDVSSDLSIIQRNLESFDCFVIVDNSFSDDFTCINCHTPNRGNPEEFLIHFRYEQSGTVIYKDGEFRRINTTTSEFFGNPGSYPSWHSSGRFIAFSTGFSEIFRNADINRNPVETYNINGNIAILDLETNTMLASPKLRTDNFVQKTFANWSPDGKWLYFCQAVPHCGFDTIHGNDKNLKLQYDLLRIRFDEKTIAFGEIETVIKARELNKSVSLPNVSPDGRFLMMILTEQGTFPVWRRDSDLYLLDLQTSELKPLSIVNSDDSESYHSWSSNSRWIVFASKRNDGFMSLPYFSHLDADGNASKPFLLPQKNPKFYKSWLRSFNVIEFATDRVRTSSKQIEKAANATIINAKFGWTNENF